MLTQARLKEVLRYDPATGIFHWRGKKSGAQGRDIAGCTSGRYVRITIDGHSYRANRLAFLYMEGKFPDRFTDHIDLNKHNNRWNNLREATKSQNQANIPAQKNNKSGLKGAYYYKANKNWQSTIQKNGKTIYLGYFDTAAAAHAAYCRAAKELHGEYARTS